MFCEQCGAPVESSAKFCTRCGKGLTQDAPVPLVAPQMNAAIPVSSPPATDRVRRHLHLVATLWLVYAAIRLVGVFWLYAVGRIYMPSFIGAIVSMSHPMAHHFPFGWLFSESLTFVAGWIASWAILEIVAAWGLLERAPWARLLLLVLAILSILKFPLGTVLAIYTLWVLLPAHSGAEYDQLARHA